MSHLGFIRVAAAVPHMRVADCKYNTQRILAMLKRAESENVHVVVFPELAVTGYTCADLFQQSALLTAARRSLIQLIRESESVYRGLFIVGFPTLVDDQLFNCAGVVYGGELLGIVPKIYIPNYKEFYEERWFSSGWNAASREVVIGESEVPFGTHLIFDGSGETPGFVLGVEICEDLWTPSPPSCEQALAGATILTNLSASNEVIGKAAYRRQLVQNQSARCLAAYIFTSCGIGESTTDVVFGGHCLIAENGTVMGESHRFDRDESLIVADVDVERMQLERARMNSFGDGAPESDAFQRIPFFMEGITAPAKLARTVDSHPFVPRQSEQLRERCEDIFATQVAGLAKRLEHIGKPSVSIGISGGLDSTLALLVACKTFDRLDAPRAKILGLTMPGFGTSSRTLSNARSLMQQLQITSTEIDIRQLCFDEMKALGHKPFGIALHELDMPEFENRLKKIAIQERHDLVFENVQARMRTHLLMNSGFVIGTGDLSELALGWCTYNGDHMSMYNPNVSIPKTLVQFLVRWAAENEFEGEERETLLDIVDTKISPELLPVGEDEELQSTEETIGPYELHDFFLYHFLRFGASPQKISYLAQQTKFDENYSKEEIGQWLKVFIKRFFANQFKRSCLPDGPKVGTVSLSPRGDWRMPSDAHWTEWMAEE